MNKEPSNSLLQELNNNPSQFTRIMEILNQLQNENQDKEGDEKADFRKSHSLHPMGLLLKSQKTSVGSGV